MTITINNMTVNDNAPQATIIGVLPAYDTSGTVIPCTFTVTKNSAGFFAISGNNLVTAFSGSISPGIYSVRVSALGPVTGFIASAIFNVSVIASPPPPPPAPPPPRPTIAVNGLASGTVVQPNSTLSIAVAGGPEDPTDWAGIATSGQAQNTETVYAYLVTGTTQRPPIGSQGVSSAILSLPAPSTSGNYEARFYADNGTTTATLIATAPFMVNSQGVVTPTGINLSPASATIPDNAPAGTVIATANVTMSDGSQFTGTLTTSNASFFAISGLNIVTAQPLTSAADGTPVNSSNCCSGHPSIG